MNIREVLDSEMNQINYGWVDKEGNPHEQLQGFSEDYALQNPAELRESKLGVCWDQVELEREILKNQEIAARTYFIVYYDDKNAQLIPLCFLSGATKRFGMSMLGKSIAVGMNLIVLTRRFEIFAKSSSSSS